MKLRDALKAGTGLPDVAQMEFNSIPSFKALNALADMGAAGANDVKDKFVDWTWKSASATATRSMAFRGIRARWVCSIATTSSTRTTSTVPETWDDFAEAALKLAKDKPGTFITNFGVGDRRLDRARCSGRRAGGRSMSTAPTSGSSINDQIAKDWADYWQKLIDAKAVDTAPIWTTEWFAAFDNGTYASWVTAAWGPALMSASMKESVGKWRAAKHPAVEQGRQRSVSNWGGSTFAAFTATPHLKEATLVRHVHGRRSGGRAATGTRSSSSSRWSRSCWPTRQ